MSFVHEFIRGSSPWTLLTLHGTGGDERQMLGLAQAAMPKASVISPLGKVREGLAPRFFRRLAEGVFDMEDLVFRTHELADWLTEASAKYGFSLDRLVGVGYSNGASMAASLLLLRPETIHGAALLRPSVPLVPDPLPNLDHRPVLVAAGRADSITPASNADEISSILLAAGAQVTMAWSDGGHELRPEDVEGLALWLNALASSESLGAAAQAES